MRLSDALGLGDRELVSFVGAGGKKTAMHRLATEGTERGYDVGYTTTTKMPPPDLPLTVANVEALPSKLTETEPPVAFARDWVPDPERVARKVRGFDPEPLASIFDRGIFDWLLVKADGARTREFKAPGSGEPVVPDATTRVVPVASVLAVGEPLSDAVVHRPERVAAITGLSVGDAITPEAIGTVLASPRGGLKRVPDGADVTPVVNKADTPVRQETARRILEHALESTTRFARGFVTSFERDVCLAVESDAP
ncbi:anaerobic dehydrogenase cluster protein (plasmid) [Haloterrigena turkmenica DSM 5511]|uniref:Anaerobic dehydrogenase cluster protein n=1 Tax=Haloterrigena turkmenica (strain ATCC 51198 / DSM 5511 / JCM 9101 / NCIMB 13204 / VKM B-1734 / 4k) TaxID=543526 RepID=D2S091_HALTV|nr:selenium cofactor biosynthesis protein YqeC [Haloterrigena turkmenica]ADB62788.1 anaerobic dehydrogenase cluster protein [Haloterrigena turkmenica DSM 5511]